MTQYTATDCVGAIQLVEWMTGKPPSEITLRLYDGLGMTPSYTTIRNHLGSWSQAKERASTDPQAIPRHLPQYYQSVAALRRVRDLNGYPVTGFRYKRAAADIGVTYHEALAPFESWTQAKITAGVHRES